MKVTESKFIILVLYVDDILLGTNNIVMSYEVKKFLFSHFEMKEMNEVSFVIGIQIFRDRSQELLSLSQKGCINKGLKRFIMDKCFAEIVQIQKGYKFSQNAMP